VTNDKKSKFSDYVLWIGKSMILHLLGNTNHHIQFPHWEILLRFCRPFR